MSIIRSVVDRAVMIASRHARNFAPDSLTVVLHSGEESFAIEGCPTGASVAAPGWPELGLPLYVFDGCSSGLYPTVDLATFTTAFDRALADTGSTLIIAVHADVPDSDLDDAFAWRYDWQARGFTTIPIAETTALFHEDTWVLSHPWGEAPFGSVSALDPAWEESTSTDGRSAAT